VLLTLIVIGVVIRWVTRRLVAHAAVVRERLVAPQMDGLEATARIVADADWPVRVLILTTFEPDEYVYRALRAGASGFVLKDIPPEELPVAVRTVADGGALLAPSITRRLIGQFAKRLAVDTAAAGRLERLTDREREVLTAIAQGSSNAEICGELFIGAATANATSATEGARSRGATSTRRFETINPPAT
jgi:DNA-binding NarL/FixJ family response regulator